MRDEGGGMNASRYAARTIHPSSLIPHPFQSVSKPSQVMFAHQSHEDLRPGEKSKAFAEESAAAKAMEVRFVGQCSRLQLLHAEKIGELRMLAVEDGSRFADRILPPRERVDAHAVVVARDCSGVVLDPQTLQL